jgi:hypothetical protein
MASTPTQRIDRALETYLLALAGVDQCPEAAEPDVKARLRENVVRAEKAFADASTGALQAGSAAVEGALDDLAAANAAARAALTGAQPIAVLLERLESATIEALRALKAAGRG